MELMKKIFSTFLFVLFTFLILVLGLRGLPGNPTGEEINQNTWKDDGPFELSPERGRYALTMSMVENKTFHFSLPIARFTTPDLGYKNGNYVSLFAPAVSFIVAPGYIIGKYFGLSQVGAFSIILLFAIINALLIRAIAKLLGANPLASSIAALVFLFASPSFAYAVTLYQHHVTTFLILFSVWILLKWKNFLSFALVWFLCAISIPVDYPNLFFMLPIGIYAFARLFDLEKTGKVLRLKFRPLILLSLITVLVPLVFFLWFNKESYGSPLQFSGTVASVKAIDEQGKPTVPGSAGQDRAEQFINPDLQKKSSILFFSTRELPSLLYSHLFSPDRGILFYTPIMFIGIIGVFMFYKKNGKMTSLLLAIVGFNIFLYAMFGRGGWAFGSRYLIPSYAIISIFTAMALTHFSKKFLFVLFFLLLSIYSVSVNTLGAVTTNRNPPKVEAVALERISNRKEHYTYQRNWEYLNNQGSKSFVYQTFAKDYLTASQYFYIVAGSIILVMSGQIILLYLQARKGKI